MEEEIWKDVVGYEGLYQISSNGRVKRLARVSIDSLGRHVPYQEKILINYISKKTGYPCVNLSKNNKIKTWNIHTLIADAFIPNPDNLPCINHKDENRTNSVLSNLERCTYGYNMMYGTAPKRRRESLKQYYQRIGKQPRGIQYGTNLSVNQYTLDGKLIEHFKGGCPEVEEKLGFKKSCIGSCCRHTSSQAYGYVWRYEGDKTPYEKPKYNTGKDFSNCKPKSHQKFVIKIDNDGNEIERYKSISEAGQKNGFDRHLFSRTKKIDGVVEIKGMRFLIEQKENEYIPKGHKGLRPDLIGKGAKPICQYTKDGEFIAEHPSIKSAAESLGIPQCASEITNCCRGYLKTARGFVWAYSGTQPVIFKNDAIRAIIQYTTSGEYVAEYPSIRDAIKAIGHGTPNCIGNNLAGRSHSAYGYVWKYKNE